MYGKRKEGRKGTERWIKEKREWERRERERRREEGVEREEEKEKERERRKVFLSFAEAQFTSETMRTKVDFYCRYKRGVCTVVLHRNTWKSYFKSFPTLYLESRCPDLYYLWFDVYHQHWTIHSPLICLLIIGWTHILTVIRTVQYFSILLRCNLQ